MLIGRISIVIILASLRLMVWGQQRVASDSSQVLSLSGSIDTYYHKSFGTIEQAPRTSFSNLPGFSLGMVNLVTEYTTGRSGFVADLVFGPRGTDAIFNAPRYRNPAGGGSAQMINQMFVYYAVSDRLRLNAGQFNTFFGYETISPSKNTQYSTSYLFSYGPFNHTGVWADIKLSGSCTAKIAVMNPTDYTEFNPFNAYTVGGQLSMKGKKSLVNINASWGDPDGSLQLGDSIGSCSAGNALQTEVMASFTIGEKYSLGVSGAMRSIGHGQRKTDFNDHIKLERCGYYGVAVYQNLAVAPDFTLGVRSEYFHEYNGGVNAIGDYSQAGEASVVAITMSGDICVSGIRVIPEIRYDKTSTRSFTLASNGRPIGAMVSVNLAVVYTLPIIDYKINNPRHE
jgi:hypothetical protein